MLLLPGLNITRFIASIGNFRYTLERGWPMFTQYMESSARFETEAEPVLLVQRTAYPYDGAVVAIDVQGVRELALRILAGAGMVGHGSWKRRAAAVPPGLCASGAGWRQPHGRALRLPYRFVW